METQKAQELFNGYVRRRYSDRSTPKHYMSDLRIFLSQLGEKALNQVSERDIDHFIDQQHEQQLAATTINRRLATVHTFFECLASEEQDEVWRNPVNWRRHRIKEGQLLPRDASDQEVEKLFAAVEAARDAAMFGLMVGAGLRVEEVASIKVTDLDRPTSPDQMVRLLVRGKGHRERIVWLTPNWYAKVQAWLDERPVASDEHLFLNQHQRGLTKDGIQYWLRRYCVCAGIVITCHQLRHTFARRLAEERMPIESISKLLGHSQVVTTQRYTLGADPDLQEQFQQTMSQLERQALPDVTIESVPEFQRPQRQTESADQAKLDQGLQRFDGLPLWLHDELVTYTRYRWRSWKPHMASKHVTRLTCQLTRAWTWLLAHGTVQGWADLRRSDVEQWLDSRREDGLSPRSQYAELCDLRAFLKFVENRDHPIHASLFRIAAPTCPAPLPKHLSATDYERLTETVLAQTAEDTLTATAERAWFLTLAHTGARVNEMLDLRLGDLDFAGGRIIIAAPKNGKDRVAFMTPALTQAITSYLGHRDGVKDDHLWYHDNRMPTDEVIRRRLRIWGTLCQVKVTPHRLRHTFATRLINRGMALESVRKLLGHTSLDMSQHYARLYDSTVKAQFASAAAHLEGIPISDWPAFATTPFITRDTEIQTDSV